MNKNFYVHINNKLQSLKKLGLYRQLRNINENYQNNAKQNILCFSSNDYLGMASNNYIKEKTAQASKIYGNGATGSRLISGHHKYHALLEEEIASFKEKEKALLFGSGYLANLALLSCLPGQKDLILSDELNHASIIDGAKLSRAHTLHYPHSNMDYLKDFLKKNRSKFRYVFIISDAVFSMDGDIVALPKLYEIANSFDCIPILDEAHSTGVLGNNGRGIESFFSIKNDKSIIMGTLGKALGSYGAFVAGNALLVDFLINKARSFIYSTALPPASSLAAYYAIKLIEENVSIVNKLKENILYFSMRLKEAFDIDYPDYSPIFPIMIGKQNAMDFEEKLLKSKVFVKGIRPPSVAYGRSRLRATISSKHSKENIDFLVHKLSIINIFGKTI